MIIRWFLVLFMSFSLFASAELSVEEERFIEHVQSSIFNASLKHSKLSKEVLQIEGMSSPKVRHFLNNLCSMPGTHYLEIGCWKGSTFVASNYRNEASILSAVAIDNWTWSATDHASTFFSEHCKRFIPSNTIKVYSEDSFKIDPRKICINPVNIYFYDGDHVELSQELAFTYYNDIFQDLFIAVVDDWNHPPVQVGTRKAFEKLGYHVLFEEILPANGNGDNENWWNGLYVAVIRK